jgi:hypothetical protein
MRRWILVCPNCGTENPAQRAGLAVTCGSITCLCTCGNCGTQFEGEQEYWRWLGVQGGPEHTDSSQRSSPG